jgi:hypothetical protein
LPGKAAAGQRAFAHGFAGLAGGLAGARGHQALVNHPAGDRRIGVEETHQAFINNRGDDAVDFGVDEFDLGLRFKTRVGQLDAQTQTKPSRTSSPGNGRVLFLDQIIGARVLVDGARQGRAEAGQMRPAVGVGNRVGEAEDLIGVTVVVLQDAIDQHLVLLPRQHDGLGMEHFLVPAQLADEFLDAVAVKKPLGFVLHPFVLEGDFDAGIQEGQFAQAAGQDVELELGRDGENGRVRLEGDERAGVLGLPMTSSFCLVTPRSKAM